MIGDNQENSWFGFFLLSQFCSKPALVGLKLKYSHLWQQNGLELKLDLPRLSNCKMSSWNLLFSGLILFTQWTPFFIMYHTSLDCRGKTLPGLLSREINIFICLKGLYFSSFSNVYFWLLLKLSERKELLIFIWVKFVLYLCGWFLFWFIQMWKRFPI